MENREFFTGCGHFSRVVRNQNKVDSSWQGSDELPRVEYVVYLGLWATLQLHSEPELALDGFEMNLGNDYHPSLVPHVG